MRKQWPLFAALALLWLAIASVVGVSVRQNNGRLVYALDDPYISMSIARNLAEHGVWGVSRHEFTSASSSILWPLLLGLCDRLGWPLDATPLILNALFASLVLGLCYLALQDRLRKGHLFLALFALLFVTPLPLLVVIGLEHPVHLLLTLAAAWLGSRQAATGARPSPVLLALVMLLVSARYEGLFLAIVLGLLFLFRSGWPSAGLVIGAALAPVGVFGLVSVAHGWHVLPNSLLLKGAIKPLIQDIVGHGLFSAAGFRSVAHLCGLTALQNLLAAPAVLFLLVWAMVAWVARRTIAARFAGPGDALLILFAGTTLIHMQLAGVGYLFRYEAYLVGLGLFVLLFSLRDLTPVLGSASAAAPVAVLAMLTMLAFGHRAVATVVLAPQAMRNVYEQQFQMGLFLGKHYPGARVLAHDIGAISYLADVRITDIVGLGTREVFDMKLAGALDEGAIAAFGRAADIAVIYPGHVGSHGRVPAEWVKVGAWTIRNNVICAEPTVDFYATDAGRASELARRLREFGAELPADIAQTGQYTQAADRPAPGP